MRKRVSKEKPRVRAHLPPVLPLFIDVSAFCSSNKICQCLYQHGKKKQDGHSLFMAYVFMDVLNEALDAQTKRRRTAVGQRVGLGLSLPGRQRPRDTAAMSPGHRSGVVTPAVRSSSSLGAGSSSVPSKRQRIGENGASLGTMPAYTGGRAPLGAHTAG